MVRPLDEPPQFVGQGEPLRFADPPPTPAMNLNATQPNLSFVRNLCYNINKQVASGTRPASSEEGQE